MAASTSVIGASALIADLRSTLVSICSSAINDPSSFLLDNIKIANAQPRHLSLSLRFTSKCYGKTRKTFDLKFYWKFIELAGWYLVESGFFFTCGKPFLIHDSDAGLHCKSPHVSKGESASLPHPLVRSSWVSGRRKDGNATHLSKCFIN